MALLQMGLDGLEERDACALDPLAAEAAENCHRDTGSDMTVTLGGGSPGFIVQLRHDFSRPMMRAVLVGRQTELRLLSALLSEGRPVVVHGEAGVGKTALVRAAVEATEQKLVEAGALATLSWLPYLPLRRALGREPYGADAAYVARELIEGLGDAILLLDDLHWADAQTRETVPFLAGRTRSSRPCADRRRDRGARRRARARRLRAPGSRAARFGRCGDAGSAAQTGSRPGARRTCGSPFGRQSAAARRARRLRRADREPRARARRTHSRARRRLAPDPGAPGPARATARRVGGARRRTTSSPPVSFRSSTAQSRFATRCSRRSSPAGSGTTSAGRFTPAQRELSTTPARRRAIMLRQASGRSPTSERSKRRRSRSNPASSRLISRLPRRVRTVPTPEY